MIYAILSHLLPPTGHVAVGDDYRIDQALPRATSSLEL
jgi:hypothetical protein